MKPKIGFKPVLIADQSGKFAIWDGNPPRPPRRGEMYLSGAIVVAYVAGQDLTTECFIAVPMRRRDGVHHG